MENYKKQEIENKNCQNDINSLNINNTITNNPQEIANTFNDYFLTVADTVIGNIKRITMILWKT
jgi:GTP-sensing pleiotropic transcriptional regulator CodY